MITGSNTVGSSNEGLYRGVYYFDGASEKILNQNSGASFYDLYSSQCNTFFNVAGGEFTGSEYIVDFTKTEDGYYWFRFTDCSSSTNSEWLTYWYLFIGQQGDDVFFVPVKEDGKTYAKAGCITGFKTVDSTHMKMTIYGKEVSFESYSDANLYSLKGLEPNKPSVQSIYLSNLSRNEDYNLSDGYLMNIGAVIGIKKDVNHYWFADVVGYQLLHDDSYNLLLCHTQKPDPGVTGYEPFRSQSGLFWSRMLIKPASDLWEVLWSSEWTKLPQNAFDLSLDMHKTCSASPVKRNRYRYNFYYGKPVLESGFYRIDRGTKLGSYSLDTYEIKSFTFAELLNLSNVSATPSVPEGYTGEWWYTTNKQVGDISYYRFIPDSSPISIDERDFYYEIKEIPAEPAAGQLPENHPIGTFKTTAGGGHTAIVTETSVTYDGVEYRITSGKLWQSGSNYAGIAYTGTNGGTKYAFYINHYYTKAPPYFHFRPPKEYDGELTDTSNWDIMNSQIKNFYKQ